MHEVLAAANGKELVTAHVVMADGFNRFGGLLRLERNSDDFGPSIITLSPRAEARLLALLQARAAARKEG